jgi:L-lactate dehydrogenase complex protein LldG
MNAKRMEGEAPAEPPRKRMEGEAPAEPPRKRMEGEVPAEPSPAATAGHEALLDFTRTLRRRNDEWTGGAALPGLNEIDKGSRQVLHDANLAAVFEKTATAAGCKVRRMTVAECPTALASLLGELGARTALIEAAPECGLAGAPAAALKAAAERGGCTVHVETNDDILFSVDVGVTGVAAAIAETGTLVTTSGPATARGSSLIPPVHVAVVRASQILPDLCDFFAGLASDPQLPANVNLITGPSKTADIEGILVTGMHGPGEVYVLLVSDA